jgi:hypothetical protein
MLSDSEEYTVKKIIRGVTWSHTGSIATVVALQDMSDDVDGV